MNQIWEGLRPCVAALRYPQPPPSLTSRACCNRKPTRTSARGIGRRKARVGAARSLGLLVLHFARFWVVPVTKFKKTALYVGA